MLDGAIIIDSLLMVSVFDRVFELDVLSVLGPEKHVFREDVDNCKNVQHLQNISKRSVGLQPSLTEKHFYYDDRHKHYQNDVHDGQRQQNYFNEQEEYEKVCCVSDNEFACWIKHHNHIMLLHQIGLSLVGQCHFILLIFGQMINVVHHAEGNLVGSAIFFYLELLVLLILCGRYQALSLRIRAISFLFYNLAVFISTSFFLKRVIAFIPL